MDLPDHFEFSQSSLQDFVDCRKRFQLRYLQRIAWPAIQAEPARENEQHMQRGERFHHLVQQFLLGMPESRLTRMAEADDDPHLLVWWQNFMDCVPSKLSGTRYVEVALTAPLGSFRLVAKYDLLLFQTGGRVVIYDWKTSLHKPSRTRLLERLQTRVYPYLLAQAGTVFNQGRSIAPEMIEMIYWFADPAQTPEQLAYTRERFNEDEHYLLTLTQEIQSLKSEDFELPDNDQHCGYCVYRSLCNRGTQADQLSTDREDFDSDEPGSLDIDLEQIGEISF